jgi:hypothetical protein
VTEKIPPITIETPQPPYRQIAEKLTTVYTENGGSIEERFPEYQRRFTPNGPMVDYYYGDKLLVLHPWISPRQRAEALLDHTVRTLVEKHGKRKTGPRAETRPWAIAQRVGRRLGFDTAHTRRDDAELTVHERAIADRLIAALETEAAP